MNAQSTVWASRVTLHTKENRLHMDDSAAAEDLNAAGVVPAAAARRLLAAVAAVAAIGDNHSELAKRRRAFLATLAEVIGADCGWWSWGRGRPKDSTITPIANISFGFADNQRAVMIEWGLDAQSDREFRQPIIAKMGDAKSSTDLRRDIMSDEQWATFSHMRRQLALGGWGSWLHSVRYSDHDTWSNFFLLRNTGKEEFGCPEAVIVDTVLNSIPWLQSTAAEFLPPEAFLGITPRQRTVMLLLLDGLPRKTIARQLEIAEDTVSDHIKSIYTHFGVNSAGELAALFLRSR